MFTRQKVLLRTFVRWNSSITLSREVFRIAIVGSGPAGFYTAHHLLQKCPSNYKLSIDFYERLPAPYGLSRYGVAPDHPEVKNCEEFLDNLMTAHEVSLVNRDGHTVRFFGNVEVGKEVSLKQLESTYHSVVLSYGCANIDNRMNIPGGDLPAVITARQFVNWYNCHPDSYDKVRHFRPPPLSGVKNVTIIGNGNVALDVARVLLANPVDHWASTDISRSALNLLENSGVKNVNIVARRGFFESAFSNKEIRELLELSNSKKIRFIPIDPNVMQPMHESELTRVEKRRFGIFKKYSNLSIENPDKSWSLQYLKSPVEFIVDESNPELLSKTIFRRNRLHHDELTKEVTIVPTEEMEEIENELVILSIGYKGIPLEDFQALGISFDKRKNRVVHVEGRILENAASKHETDIPHVYKRGWYTSGWIKNGPKGVIATTMMDSFETAHNILDDLSNGVYSKVSIEAIKSLEEKLKTFNFVSWNGWLKVNKKELDDGKQIGCTRLKICDRDDMISIAHK